MDNNNLELNNRELLITAIIAYNNLDAESIEALKPKDKFKLELENLREKLGEFLEI